MNFIAKQALGGVTKDLQSLTKKEEEDPDAEKRRQEHQEALQEQENERKAKHAKFEAGRESARNKIRNKHGLRTAEEKAEAERQANDPMGIAMAAPMPDSMKETKEYEDSMMGNAEWALDEAKNRVSNIGETVDTAKESMMEAYNSKAPDQCKQQ